ncbi:hypothetical protein Neosp_011828 [[Neocosmospora] mangrovei]
MSLEDYQAALPELFGAQGTVQPAVPDTTQPTVEGTVAMYQTKPAKHTKTKGFADIIEYHTEGLSGHDVQIIPTERFLPNKKKSTKKQQTYKEYAVVLRRTWTQHKQVSLLVRVELEIQSEVLCRAFRQIAIDSYEDTDLESFPIKLRSPFSELFFYRNEIRSLMEDENNSDEIRQGAEILHNFILKNGLMASIVTDHERYSKEGQAVGDILWTIYPPNSLLVLNVGKLQECWICRNVSSKQDKDGFSHWEVVGFRIGHSGASPGLTRQTFRLPITGMQVCKISDLPLVPVKNFQDWPLLEKTLHARAARLQKVLGDDLSLFAPQNYADVGWLIDHRDYHISLDLMSYADQLDDRVVVDYKGFLGERRNGAAELVDLEGKLKQPKSRAKARGVLANAEHRSRLKGPRSHGSSDTDSSGSDSESVEFDSEDDADIMEFKTAGDSQEPHGSSRPKPNNLSGLFETVKERFNISKTDFDLLFPAQVPAFGLKKKEWRWILSDQLQDVAWNMVAFESLQIEKATKHLVQALVKGHKANSTAFDDVVSGKGQGLVFLLHGHVIHPDRMHID